MNTNDINIFLTVYECKSFNQAAKQVSISPQGMIKVIQRIENELGVQLFLRTSKGILPTRDADYFYMEGKKLLRTFLEIRNHLNPKNKIDTLRFFYTYGIMSYLTLDYIDEFSHAYPGVNLITEEMSDDMVQQSILDGTADVGIITGPVDIAQLNSRLFTEIKYVSIVNTNSPLAKKQQLDYIDFHDQKIALLSHHCRPYSQLLERIKAVGAVPSIIYETEQLQFNHERASINNCIGQSIDYFASHIRYENTCAKPFSDRSFTWDSYFIWKGDSSLITLIDDFIRFTLEWKDFPILFTD